MLMNLKKLTVLKVVIMLTVTQTCSRIETSKSVKGEFSPLT